MTDRLFARLPGHVRARDAAEGSPLRALLAVAESEFDLLEDDVAQLYDDWFIETCEEWAVPYIGALLGARRLNPAGGEAFSLRAYIANTLAYRQAKGTAAVIEQLSRDVTNWPARVVEYWRLLVQSQNFNHVRSGNVQTVDLRDADRAAQIDSPFDPWAHNLEIRSIARGLGRYAIPGIGIFLWRLLAAPIGFAFGDPTQYQGGVAPREVAAGDGRFHLHPAGLDVPLFNRPRGEPAIGHLAEERELPAPLRRLPLWKELEAWRAGIADPAGYFGVQPVFQVRLGNETLPPERLHIANLGEQTGGGWRHPAAAGQVMVDPVLGRLSLHPDDAAAPLEVAYASGAVGEIGAGPWDRRLAFAQWFPAFLGGGAEGEPWIAAVTRRTDQLTDNPDNGGPCVGSLAAALTLWNTQSNAAGARGVIAVLDNATYDESLPQVEIAAGARLAVLAAAWPPTPQDSGAQTRLVAALVPAVRRPFIAAELQVHGAGAGSGLVLDGLMLEGGITVAAGALGNLTMRTCTIGASAAGLISGIIVAAGGTAPDLSLIRSISGPIQYPPLPASLQIQQGIIGEDRTADAGAGILTDSIAIAAAQADIDVATSTIFGRITARTLSLSGSIVTGLVTAARRQEGCARYSLVPLGSRTAPRYRCQPDLALAAAAAAKRAASGDPSAQLTDAEIAEIARALTPRFTATRFEAPAFAQLHALAADGVVRGGEGGTEMGVFGYLGEPLRMANLREALADSLRLGLEAGLFAAT